MRIFGLTGFLPMARNKPEADHRAEAARSLEQTEDGRRRAEG